MKEANKYLFYILASLIIGLAIGFFVGRNTIDTKEVIKYEKGETIETIVRVPEPYKVVEPSDPVFIYKTDTINNIIIQKVDTPAIITDWIKSRDYNITLFDNDNGKLYIDANVQYNQLQDLQYTFTPIYKTVINYRKPVYIPFVGVSYNSLGYMSAGGGLFYHDIGIELRYTTDFNKEGVDLGFKCKF